MSQKKSTKKLHTSKMSENSWQQAIADAESEIIKAKRKISNLRQAIRSFEVMRDAGEPWPGTVRAATPDAFEG